MRVRQLMNCSAASKRPKYTGSLHVRSRRGVTIRDTRSLSPAVGSPWGNPTFAGPCPPCVSAEGLCDSPLSAKILAAYPASRRQEVLSRRAGNTQLSSGGIPGIRRKQNQTVR